MNAAMWGISGVRSSWRLARAPSAWVSISAYILEADCHDSSRRYVTRRRKENRVTATRERVIRKRRKRYAPLQQKSTDRATYYLTSRGGASCSAAGNINVRQRPCSRVDARADDDELRSGGDGAGAGPAPRLSLSAEPTLSR